VAASAPACHWEGLRRRRLPLLPTFLSRETPQPAWLVVLERPNARHSSRTRQRPQIALCSRID